MEGYRIANFILQLTYLLAHIALTVKILQVKRDTPVWTWFFLFSVSMWLWVSGRFAESIVYLFLPGDNDAYHFQGFIIPDYNFTPMEYIGTPVDRDSARHQMEVFVTGLRVRKRPEINDEVVLGFANVGYYNVISTRDMTGEASNGYYWYEIEPDRWVARKDDSWTRDFPAVVVDVDELKRQIAELSEKMTAIEQENAALAQANAALADKISAAVGILS